MRLFASLLLLCLVTAPSLLFASEQPSQPQNYANIDLILDRAISQNLIAGGVVVVGNHEGILATAARGHLTPSASSPLLDERTMFDLASLTKVVATTPAVMKLLDEGKIALSDPIAKYFPEFAEAHSSITILNLLTHTSGLDDFSVGSGIDYAVRRAAAERSRPGSHFHYADINFILLGELVHRVSGETLDAFCRDEIFKPIGETETMYLPPRDIAGAIAPTSGYSAGVVQDPNARRLGGVAGHAGVFSSAYDLSLYARMILGNGSIDGKRVLSEQIVSEMTSPHLCNNGTVRRGLGWDISSGYSAPKGNLFSESSFGHTGYSGSSIWIDPQQDMFVILLTRRVDYRDTHSFNELRRMVSTVAAGDSKGMGDDGHPIVPAVAVASTDAKIVKAAATQAIQVYEQDGVLVATNIAKERPQRHVQLRPARTAKSCAKTVHRRSTHVTRVARGARMERGRIAHVRKSRRNLAKS